MRRCPFSLLDLIGPFAFLDLGQQAQRHEPLRRRDEQVLKSGGRPVLVGDAHHHVEPAIAFDDLRHHAAARQPLQRLRQRGRRDAVERRALIVGRHLQLGDQHLLFHQRVHDAGHRLQARPQAPRHRTQRVEIVAEDLEDDLRLDARQHMVDAVRDRLADGHRRRQHGQLGADIGVDVLLAAHGPRQVDIDLGVVDALGMLVELRPAGAPAEALHLRE